MAEKAKKNGDFKTMGLGDHLEELRARIILALAGLVVGAVICPFLFTIPFVKELN